MAALDIAAHQPLDLVMADMNMPELDGLTLLTELRSRNQSMPMILMTAFGSLKNAKDSIRAGAFYYLSKPFILDDVRLVVCSALEHAKLFRENQQSKEWLHRDTSGADRRSYRCTHTIARVVQADRASVLTRYETKE